MTCSLTRAGKSVRGVACVSIVQRSVCGETSRRQGECGTMHRCETDDAMRRSRVGVTAVCNPASRQVQHRLRRRLPYGAARCSAVLNTSPHSCLCVVDMSTEHKFAQSFPCPPPLHSTSATVLALRSGRDQRDLGWAHRGSQTHWRALQGRQRSVRTPSFTRAFFNVRRHSVVLMFLFLVLPFLACVLRCVRKMSSLFTCQSAESSWHH
jgi:hypothetical protein